MLVSIFPLELENLLADILICLITQSPRVTSLKRPYRCVDVYVGGYGYVSSANNLELLLL